MNPKILFEDDNIIAIDKPAGIVVHQGAGEIGETVADWLVKNYPEIGEKFGDDGRPGIVHRLDKDTSGILLCAKNPMMRQALQSQFKNREIVKKYQTLVLGEIKPAVGRLESYISRDPKNRQTMKIGLIPFGLDSETQRNAILEYKTLKNYDYSLKKQPYKLSLLSIDLQTGRMHQIRVQLKYDGHPVIGDETYFTKPSRKISAELGTLRQFLHSYHLEFTHPISKEKIILSSDLPTDLEKIIEKISS